MAAEGLISIVSAGTYAATIDRLDAALRKRGIVPVAKVDHSTAASEVGLKLRPLLLVIFGDPRVGTPLMQEEPTAGIDLPLKLLIWEDEQGAVQVGYNDPTWIRERHGVRLTSDPSGGMAASIRDLALSTAGAIESR